MTKLNGYNLQKFFWHVQSIKKLDAYHVAIYFYIVELCNRLRWGDTFRVPAAHTAKVLNITKKTFLKKFHQLEEAGLIHIIQRGKSTTAATKITLASDQYEDWIEKKQVRKSKHATESNTPVAGVPDTPETGVRITPY